MNLLDDIARCLGIYDIDNGEIRWREACKSCARRLCASNNSEYVVMMAPPTTTTSLCEYYIEYIGSQS